MTASQLDFTKPAMLDGNSDGKMPYPRWDKWGWWFWPVAALALAGGTIWGAEHIESQVESAAPAILDHAGINTDTLTFNARYRDVFVSGSLPSDVSAEQISTILTTQPGIDNQSIRNAYFENTNGIGDDIRIEKIQSPMALQEVATTSNIQVAAIIENKQLTLSGSVPAISHAATLAAAAVQAFEINNIDNQLQTAEQIDSDDSTDASVAKLAMILSNLDDKVVEAKLYLDNELLTGRIYASSIEAQSDLQALVAGNPVTILSIVEPAVTPVSQIDLLQQKLNSLQDEITSNIVFASASDALQPSSYEVLEKISAAMKEYPQTSVEVGGHTDSQSSASYNIDLSERRAFAVATYLSESGIDLERLTWNGYGESLPIYPNDTPENRAKNRRVEFWVQQYH